MSTTEYRATFSALSLVCRMFRAECQPRLFRTLRFRGHPKTTRSEVFWNNLPGIDEERCTTLLGGVRDCTFYWWFNNAVLDRALSKVIRSADLTNLSLLRCGISISTLALIAALPGVHTLILDGCDFQLSATNTPVYTSRPKWTSISVLSAQNGDIRPWFLSSLLQLVDLRHLEFFSTDHINLASPFFRGRCAPKLSNFRLGGWGGRVTDLYAILEVMPHITTLSIPSRNWIGLHPPPRHVAPLLRSLTAHPPIAAQLVPHRPVSVLELLHFDFNWDYAWPETCFRDVQGSTTGLREVSIPSHVLASIRSQDLPVVEILTLRPRCGKRIQTIHFPASILRSSRKRLTDHRVSRIILRLYEKPRCCQCMSLNTPWSIRVASRKPLVS